MKRVNNRVKYNNNFRGILLLAAIMFEVVALLYPQSLFGKSQSLEIVDPSGTVENEENWKGEIHGELLYESRRFSFESLPNYHYDRKTISSNLLRIPTSKKNIPNLIAASTDENAKVRLLATFLLGEIESGSYFREFLSIFKIEDTGDEIINALKKRLRDMNYAVRYEAQLSLRQLKWIPHNIEDKIFYATLTTKDVERMVKSGINFSSSVPYLIQELELYNREKQYSPREFAIRKLGIIGDKRAIQPLLDIWDFEETKNFEDLHIRALIGHALRNLIDERVFEKMLSLTRSSVREDAIYVLGAYGLKTKEVIAELRFAMFDKKVYVRKEAEKSLEKLGIDPKDQSYLNGKSVYDVKIALPTPAQYKRIETLLDIFSVAGSYIYAQYGRIDSRAEELINYGNIALSQILDRLSENFNKNVKHGSVHDRRKNMLLLLGEIRPVSQLAIDALLNAFEYSNTIEAADVLGRIQPPPIEAIPVLRGVLEKEKRDPYYAQPVTGSVSEALVEIIVNTSTVKQNIDTLALALEFVKDIFPWNRRIVVIVKVREEILGITDLEVLRKLPKIDDFKNEILKRTEVLERQTHK